MTLPQVRQASFPAILAHRISIVWGRNPANFRLQTYGTQKWRDFGGQALRFNRQISENGLGTGIMAGLICALAIMVALTTIMAGDAERAARMADMEIRLRTVAVQRANMLTRTLEDWRAQARFLSLVPSVAGLTRAALSNGIDPQDNSSEANLRQRLEATFTGFIASRPGIVRVAYFPAPYPDQPAIHVETSDSRLNDTDADLLPIALRQGRGVAYIADIDLARADGQVVLPRMPLLRVALPTTGGMDKPAGMIALTIDARRSLADFAADLNPSMRLFLLNAEGDFLVHPDSTRTFGWAVGRTQRWADQFPQQAGQPAGAMVTYDTAEGPMHVVRQRVALDDNDQGRYLTVAVGMYDSAIASSVQATRTWVTAVGSGMTVIVLLLGMAWRRSVRRATQLRRRDAWLGAIVNSAGEAIIGLDNDGRIASWNPAAVRLFGIARERALGRLTTDLIVPPTLTSEEEGIQAQAAQGGAVHNFITRRHQADGRPIDVSVSVVPVRDGDSVAGRAMVIRDITEQLASESSMRALNARLEQQVRERTMEIESLAALQQAVLNHAGSAIIATDRSGTITLFNPAAEALLGYSAGELVGKATPMVLHDPVELTDRAPSLRVTDEFQTQKIISLFMATDGTPSGREWTYLRKDGTRVPVLLVVTVLRDGAGIITGYLGIATDLSAQKQTAERLRQALAAAETASRAKSAFLANMSHEIRTPLNGIIGSAHLLLEERLTQHQHTLIDSVRRAAAALSTIVNDILDYSRIDAGLVSLQPEPFRLCDPVDAIVDLFTPVLRSRRVTLEVTLAPDLPSHVVGDAARIRQILDNLVGNAVKFTHSGVIGIDIRSTGQTPERVGLAITVSDTGIGMNAEQTARLFQPFSIGDDSHHRRHGGAGLGLALTRRLVGMMGGSIHVESQEGAGSRFVINLSLPIAAAPEVQVYAALPAPVATEGDSPLPGLAGAHILLAEDNELNQIVAQGFLERAGAFVDIVGDGAAAIAAVDRKAYDLILMDVQMPGMDGLEATRAIRSSPKGQNIPILAMSAATGEEDLKACRQAGMDDTVAKPFVPALFLSTLQRWLSDGETPPVMPVTDGGNGTMPDPIDGIDMEQAWGRVLANRQLLETILDQFLDRFDGTAARMRQRLLEGQWEQTARAAHELRGAAGNIAATRVTALATDLELSIRRQQGGNHAELLDALESALVSLCAAIRGRNRIEPEADPTPEAVEPVALDLEAIRAALRSRNLSAVDIMAMQQKPLTEWLGADKVQELIRLVGSLRYAEALRLLDDSPTP